MKLRSPAFVFGLIAALIIGFGLVAGVVLGLRAIRGLGYEPPVLQATKTGPNSAELDISAYPDGQVCHTDDGNPQITWVSYCPTTSFEVPANSLVTVVIEQYDTPTGLYNGFFQNVQGTVGGTATYNGNVMDHLAQADIAHTFTLQSPPFAANPLYVNVPLLGVPSNAPTLSNGYPKPAVIKFQFRTGAGGAYIWHCYVPCGDGRETPYGFSGAMSTTGYMAGTMTVTSY